MTLNLLKMIFQRNFTDRLGKYELDVQTLRVLSELDGVRNVETVSDRVGIAPIELRPILTELYQQGLIEPIAVHTKRLKPELILYMVNWLADAIGPMAAIVVNDSIRQLGEDRNSFPAARSKELIEAIAAKIIISQKKEAFLTLMQSKLAEEKG